MPGKNSSIRPVPKQGEVAYEGRMVTAVTLKPGDRLPKGTFLKGWQLDGAAYGANRLYLLFEKDDGS